MCLTSFEFEKQKIFLFQKLPDVCDQTPGPGSRVQPINNTHEISS